MSIADGIPALQAEWLKKSRSLGSWLVVAGSLFTPAIILTSRFIHHRALATIYNSSSFWTSLWKSAWESMAIFFLPMAAILVTSLITQIEYRNNAWKQVLTLPISLPVIFLSKLAVILALMAQFFLLFDIAIYLAAVIPCLLLAHLPYPTAPLPLHSFTVDTLRYMAACLPIVTAQYLLGLRFKNFLVPIGVGFMMWVSALAALPSRFAFVVPYAYTILSYLKDDPRRRVTVSALQINCLALGYALLFTFAGYWLFRNKPQKG